MHDPEGQRFLGFGGWVIVGVLSTLLILNGLYLGFNAIVMIAQIFHISLGIGLAYVFTGLITFLLLPAGASFGCVGLVRDFAQEGTRWHGYSKATASAIGVVVVSWLAFMVIGYLFGVLTAAIAHFL